MKLPAAFAFAAALGGLALAAAAAPHVVAKPAVAPQRDAGAPRDLSAPSDLALPRQMPRALSDAWGYNTLQLTVLRSQKDRILDEIGRLELDRAELLDRLRALQVNPNDGDTWNERSLEIHRRTRP